jgi:hypothetical protein
MWNANAQLERVRPIKMERRRSLDQCPLVGPDWLDPAAPPGACPAEAEAEVPAAFPAAPPAVSASAAVVLPAKSAAVIAANISFLVTTDF